MNTSAEQSLTVIVGAGQAGAEVATALRQHQYPGRILMIGEEPWLPYRRPPLSKTYLSGTATVDTLLIRGQNLYEKHGIELLLKTRVVGLDRANKQLRLADGRVQAYDKLVLTTGGTPRRLPNRCNGRPNIHYIRTIDDVDALKSNFVPGRKLVVIGGGYIGLEAAAVAAKNGLHVTVVETQPRLLARVAVPEVSAYIENLHRRHGVTICTGIGVDGLVGEDKVTSAHLTDGTCLPVDLVVVGIGLLPNVELASGAGLRVQDGIVVDEYSRTSDPDILAAGDCANHFSLHLGRGARFEAVSTAQDQAKTAAMTICGKPSPYSAVPWFWSDQYDVKLQMVGVSQGHDQMVVRGSLDTDSFSIFYLKSGAVISVDTVNRPRDFSIAKRLVADKACIDPALLADETLPLGR